MSQFNTKNIILIFVIINILGIFGLVMIYLDIKKINQQTSTLQYEVEVSEKKESAIKSASSLITNMSSDLNKIKTYIISKDGTVGFIEYIESLGRESGVKVENEFIKDDSDSKIKADKGILKIGVGVSGSWNGIQKFLALLESSTYKIVIDSVNFSIPTDKTLGTAWSGRIEFSVAKIKE